MPRRPRPDIEPEILLQIADVRDAHQRASNAAGAEYRVKVRRIDDQQVSDGWIMAYDTLSARLDQCRRRRVNIDEGLLRLMLHSIDMARSVPVLGPDHQPVRRDGLEFLRLRRVGCRLRMTQEQIAAAHGVSRQHVVEQIGKLREAGIVVNWGQGWFEFDAALCWRGDHELRAAYARQQRRRDGRDAETQPEIGCAGADAGTAGPQPPEGAGGTEVER
jgi:DNA-binding IclR family transcriptional regulator